ncbi:hypothetical protein M413DRAFT_212372 [Hebeloma cylindrosporum]|uniref:Uncharacterized protein n=1 Tax=Hebeloma cylindrosporum TaxID=76867 RepID=A0A0C3CGJ6_HEBCY|nr:hypothetical protein M413DRAFT_212372 [Hebeloma cylindrosporum h7]
MLMLIVRQGNPEFSHKVYRQLELLHSTASSVVMAVEKRHEISCRRLNSTFHVLPHLQCFELHAPTNTNTRWSLTSPTPYLRFRLR